MRRYDERWDPDAVAELLRNMKPDPLMTRIRRAIANLLHALARLVYPWED